MAVLKDSRVVLLGLVCGAGVVAQQAHRVNDPMELVVTPAQVADTAEKRADALALLERARQNTNLHAPGGAPYTLRISFNAADQGDGQLEETWFSGQDWSWTVRFGSFSLSRVIVGGRVWDDAPHNSIPLRLQTLRNAVFWPVVGNVAPDLIRTAAVNSNGVSLTCVLVSPAYTNAANAPRITEEREYCVDPASGLLQQYSPAPRMEMIYSYAGGPQFRGHTLPRTISVYEAGNRILTAQIEGIDDPGAPQPARATTGMSSGVVLSAPYRLRHFVPVPQGVEPFR